MIRRLLVNLLLLILVCALLAGAAEGALRIAGAKAPSYVTPELYGNVNLLYRPESRTRWRGNLGQVLEFDTPIMTNSIAQFDREHETVKPSGVYRILILGDSYVEALQVPLEKWFGTLLDQALDHDPQVRAAGLNVEVIKLGGSGNGAIREYELWKTQGAKYSPDLILAFFTDSNDLKDDWHYYRRVTGREVYKHVNLKPSPKLYDKLDFYKKILVLPPSWLNRWVAFLMTEAREKRRRKDEDVANWKDTLGAYALPGSSRFAEETGMWKEAMGLTAGAHLKIAREAAETGAIYAVALIDRPQTYRPDAYRYLFKIMPDIEREVDLDLPAKNLKAVLGSRGIGHLDLNGVFSERHSPGRTGHYRYDGHWDADGPRWAAEALLPFVKERILYERKA